jgi:hypothetical protein
MVNVLGVSTVRFVVTAAGIDLASVLVISPGLIVFGYTTPGPLPVSLVTQTCTAQVELMAILPPVREITPVPVAAVSVPPQVLLKGVELLIVMPTGNVSVKEKLLKAVSEGAVNVN